MSTVADDNAIVLRNVAIDTAQNRAFYREMSRRVTGTVRINREFDTSYFGRCSGSSTLNSIAAS